MTSPCEPHASKPAARRIIYSGVFACTRPMKVVGNDRRPDWPKLEPSIIIATALIVAIRTAKWAAKAAGDAHFSDLDMDLDKEVISPRGLASA